MPSTWTNTILCYDMPYYILFYSVLHQAVLCSSMILWLSLGPLTLGLLARATCALGYYDMLSYITPCLTIGPIPFNAMTCHTTLYTMLCYAKLVLCYIMIDTWATTFGHLALATYAFGYLPCNPTSIHA